MLLVSIENPIFNSHSIVFQCIQQTQLPVILLGRYPSSHYTALAKKKPIQIIPISTPLETLEIPSNSYLVIDDLSVLIDLYDLPTGKNRLLILVLIWLLHLKNTEGCAAIQQNDLNIAFYSLFNPILSVDGDYATMRVKNLSTPNGQEMAVKRVAK